MAENQTKRARGRPKTFDRQRTLEVAVDSYWRDGVDHVSVNEICRRASTSKPGLYREFGDQDQLMDAALARYSTTVLAPVLARLSDDRPFPQTLQSLIDFVTRQATPDVPAGCLFAKMRNSRSELGPATSKHVDRLREHAVGAYSSWLARSVDRGEIELPAPLHVAATYVDVQLTMMANQIAAGEDEQYLRAHADLAFAAFRPSQ